MEMIGDKHNNELEWLSTTWFESNTPVAFLEGFPGTGKTTLARELYARVESKGITPVMVEVPDSEGYGDVTNDLLLDLAMELNFQGRSELAEAVEDNKPLEQVLQQIIKDPILIIFDEFQRTMPRDSGRPAGGMAKTLSRIAKRPNLKGRILLLSNRIVERARWSDAYAIRNVEGMETDDAVLLLTQLLESSNRLEEVPQERFFDIVTSLGGNPRAIKLFAAALKYDSIDDVIGERPELWQTKQRHVDADFVQQLERNLLERTLDQLTDIERHKLNQLSAFRRSFKKQAIQELFPEDKASFATFRRMLIDRFLMEQHKAWFDLHPIAREIGLKYLRQTPDLFKQAHSIAARHYTRHFTAQQIVGMGKLGGYFVEARYHLTHAQQEDELKNIAIRFEKYIKSTFGFSTAVPSEPRVLDEQIALLSALLEKPGAKGLEYYLARLLNKRRVRNDLSRAIIHARRALGGNAPHSAWLLCASLVNEMDGHASNAIRILDKGIEQIPVISGVRTLYQACGKLMVKNGQIDDAIILLQEGIGRIPPEQSLFSLYQVCGELMAKNKQVDDAIGLLKEGIERIPTDKSVSALYRSITSLLVWNGLYDEANEVLDQGIRRIPEEYGRISLFHFKIVLCTANMSRSHLLDISEKQTQDKYKTWCLSYLHFLDGEYVRAADFASKYQTESIANATHRSFCELCAGRTQQAQTILDQIAQVKKVKHDRGIPITWLQALVAIRQNNPSQARQFLSLYLGEQWHGDDSQIEPHLLTLWNTPSIPWGRPDLAYYFPILPPPITGLDQTVSRIIYHPSNVSQLRTIDTETDRTASKPQITTGDNHMNNWQIAQEKRGNNQYDVFLCHNSADKLAIRKIDEYLMQQGIAPWLDERDIQPGKRWQQVLQEQIETIKSVAVFVGPDGIGPWQTLEMEGILPQFNQRGIPVIPVVLPECKNRPELPMFLSGFQWVDFRKNIPEPFERLIYGITGEQPVLLMPTDRSDDQNEQKTPASLLAEIQAIVRTDNNRIRDELTAYLDGQTDNFIDHLTVSQTTLLNQIAMASEENSLNNNDVEALFNAIQSLQQNLPTADHLTQLTDTLSNLPPVINDTQADIRHRIKATIPIIPMLIQYEGEYELSSGVNISSILREIVSRIKTQ